MKELVVFHFSMKWKTTNYMGKLLIVIKIFSK